TRSGADIVQMIPFLSKRKAMGVVVRTPTGGYRLYLKGASEIITRLCTRHVIVHRPGSPTTSDDKVIETAPITELEEENISCTIIFYANQMLRTIAIAYRDFESWPPAGYTGVNSFSAFEQPTDMPLGGQWHIISQSSVEKLTEKLAGTNYKLVRIDEHGGVTGPSSATHVGTTSSSAPNSRAPLREYPPFELKYREKPFGTAGKAPPKGYNLQEASGLSNDHHRILGTLVEAELRGTPGINMRATIDNQPSQILVENVILSFAKKYDEFKMYEDDGHWLLKAYVYTVLKRSKERYTRLKRAARIKMDPVQLEAETAQHAKKKENTKARGQASAIARKAKKEVAAAAATSVVPTEAQAATIEAQTATTKAQAATNKGNKSTPEPVVRDFLGDEVDAIAQDISMMSIIFHQPIYTGEELMDADEGSFMLPADISGSAPTIQESIATASTPPAAPPVSSPVQPPSTVIPTPLDMQRLVRLLVLSEEERALLPENLRLALAMIGSSDASDSPAPALVQVGAPAPTPTAASAPRAHVLTLASAPAPIPTEALQSVPARRPKMRPPPLQPVPKSKATYTPISSAATVLAPAPLVPGSLAPPVTVADSSATTIFRQIKARTIDQIEPGPNTLQIDDDSFSELSSDSDPPDEEGNAKDKKGKGKAKAKANPGHTGCGRGRGRGRGGSHGGGQPEPGNNINPEPAPTTTRRLRSNK
ncbi:hydrolase of sodium-potassium ATPase alpha subunit, putative, partial [Rhizoctonia solani AG-3 Rhs1AP]